MMRSTPLRPELAALMVLLLLVVVVRGTILLTGQRHLRSDEAAVGLMARHVVTRGERPLFLYGQPYGGGHALIAYVAAPLFTLFGCSAVVLTAVSTTFSLATVVLLWLILRRYFTPPVTFAATAVYAFSPPVVYQAFLVNGGAEAFFLALLALSFFLRAYLDGKSSPCNGFLAGLFSGLAYWAMDYALLYPIVFMLLWLASGRYRQWRWLAAFAAGLAAGCLPLIVHNLRHDLLHLRLIFAPPPGPRVGLVQHLFSALLGLFSGDLAAFFGGEIDDFKKPGPGAWIHAAAAVACLILLIHRHRQAVLDAFKTLPFSGKDTRPPAPELLPAVFVVVYLGMYCVAKFSLPGLRTPRYFLPLCPFISIVIALALLPAAGTKRGRKPEPQTARWRGWRMVGALVVAALVLRGAVASLRIGLRPWHEEHRIRTSGPDIRELAEFVRAKGIRYAFAPYEIQWRLMFESDEAVLVSCEAISPLQRYPAYEAAVRKAVLENREPVAFIFRRDFAFADWAARTHGCLITGDRWRAALRRLGHAPEGTPVAGEFEVFYPVPPPVVPALLQPRARPR